MKSILVTPYYHQPRGNTVTVDRISGGLNQIGISTEIISVTEEEDFPQLPSGDIVHGFNAYHFDRYWKQRGTGSTPYMITITGTDLNHHLFDDQARDKIIHILNHSQAVHVFNAKARELLWQEIPGVKDKTLVIPQSVQEFPPNQGKVEKEEGSFLFVLPAGIRKVKNVVAAISMLTFLYEKDQRIRLWIVGPILEEAEGNKVRNLVQQNAQWVRYLGQFPHGKMGDIYRCADVVLNTSISEGQSSAILEAMFAGIPVLASNIVGNQDIVSNGTTGYLYCDEHQFIHQALLLMENKELRNRMGHSGKEYVKNRHSFQKEIQALANIYREIQKKTEQLL